MDKSWMNYDRSNPRYIAGIFEFMNFVYEYAKAHEKTLFFCPCNVCRNRGIEISIPEMYGHLVRKGMMANYTIWDLHGEVSNEPTMAEFRRQFLSQRASSTSGAGPSVNPTVDILHDAFPYYAKDAVVKVKRKLGEVLETQSDGSGECISVDVQVAVIEVGVGSKKGTVIRGVGGAIRRDPKRRGVARQSFTDSQADERIQKVLEEAQLAKEEAQHAKEEALRAKEEWLRAREEIMDRLQALEAGAAAKQVHPCGSSTQIPTAQV